MAARRPTLLLVSPANRFKHYAVESELVRLVGRRHSMPSLALALLAAMTPPDWDIRVIDEEVEPLPDRAAADLVAMTALTNSMARTYWLADRFRAQGAKVVLGGPHVTFAPEEGLRHADAVVIGEAEPVWPELLDEFRAGRLRSVYQASGHPPYERSPIPRWDLFRLDEYLVLPVQASRGCPYRCDFCVVPQMFGRRLRHRALDDVVREIESLPIKRILFVDDNLTIDRTYAKALCERIAPLGVSWVCQSSLDVVDDPALLKAMADAGCDQVLVGFESLDRESLARMRKTANLRADFTSAIDTFHAAGIQLTGSFVVGFDRDSIATIDRIVEFADRAPLPFVALNLLTGYPGTAVYARMREEGRLLDVPLELQSAMFPSIRFAGVDGPTLFRHYLAALERLHRFDVLRDKALRLFGTGSFARGRSDPGFGVWAKASMSAKLATWYLLGPDRDKRDLFLSLMKMHHEGTVAVERVVMYLLAAEGHHREIRQLRLRAPALLDILGRAERAQRTQPPAAEAPLKCA